MNKQIVRFTLISLLIATSMGVGAKLHYTLLEVPSTMQTFFLCLTAFYFRPGEVLTGQVLYLIAGMFYPVFSHDYYGVDILTGDSAGYLYMFPIAATMLSKYGKSKQWFTGFSWAVVTHGLIIAGGFFWQISYRDQDSSRMLIGNMQLLPSAFVKSAITSLIYFIAEKYFNKK